MATMSTHNIGFALIIREKLWENELTTLLIWTSVILKYLNMFPNKNAKMFHFLTSIVIQLGNNLCQLSHLLKQIEPLVFYKNIWETKLMKYAFTYLIIT